MFQMPGNGSRNIFMMKFLPVLLSDSPLCLQVLRYLELKNNLLQRWHLSLEMVCLPFL